MPVRIQTLDHFAIYVTDLERSEKFYREHLFAVNVSAKDWQAARAEYQAAGVPVSESIN
jgi:catechol 2,3-dioxygenase-like lactoylglutathione lyase family enzyme